MTDTDVAQLTLLISAERLGNLVRLTGSTKAAIDLHQETLVVGSSLMNSIATVEIALRNAVSENLSHHFGEPNWLISPPLPFRWKLPERDKGAKALDSARRAEYAKLTQKEKSELDLMAFPDGRPTDLSHLARAKARRAKIEVTTGKVIAEITLHFWKRLYSPDYDQTLWRPTLKRTFPDKRVKRAEVADHLEVIYQSRNRLAHHEPVLHGRFDQTMTSIKYVVERLEAPVRSSATPLANLLSEQISEVEEKAIKLHTKLAAYRVSGP